MKYRTIIQINQSEPDLTLNIVEEEDEGEDGGGEGVRRESGPTPGNGGEEAGKVKRPTASARLSKLFRRKSSQKYDLWKLEKRKSVSDSELVQCSKISELKSTRENPDSWLVVHKLKTQSDGGILDPDDKLVDVADDREQIMAIYEEENDGIPSLQHNAGDGTSASSVGTSSPDIFQSTDHKFQPFGRTDIEITGEELNGHGSGSPNSSGLTLQVRRGSEPALNRLSPIHIPPLDASKRWSAAPIIDEEVPQQSQQLSTEGKNPPPAGGELSTNGSQGSINSSSRENSVIFNYQNHQQQHQPHKTYPGASSSANGNMINNPIITPLVPLPVRREPLSNQNQNSPSSDSYQTHQHHHHQFINGNSQTMSSHFPNGINPPSSSTNNGVLTTNTSSTVQMRPASNTLSVPMSRFSRDVNRHSMQFAMDGKWADAADRALFLSLRKEPVGAAKSPSEVSTPPPYASTPMYNNTPERDVDPPLNNQGEEVLELMLKYESGPLGIHLIPEHRGLIIQGVEPGGRIDRDGRLQAQDKIIEINGHPLLGMPFQQAQELFRAGLTLEELKLKIIKSPYGSNFPLGMSKGQQTNHVQKLVSKFNNGDVEEKENMIQGQEQIVGDAKVATVATTRKSSPGPLQSLPLMRQSTSSLISANTRKIGRKYEIELEKGPAGLGFSITTRDNPAGGNCPIYIKNVLPTGAAIEDGRLRPGDRLLEVNSIEITGKSQAEAVTILRNVVQGGIVKLLVSRQERVDLSPKLPRQIPPEKVSEEEVPSVPWSEREILVLDIPVLDTEKAGLGISVKGNAQKGNLVDNGIYIKTVIHGGAASRDGRLKPNDQLLSVNDVSLLNRSNVDAMETLRRTLTQDGPKPNPGFITLRIARRIPTSSAPTTDMSACGSSASGDEMDSWGSRNVSFSADGSRGTEQDRLNTTQVDGKIPVPHLLQDNQPFSQQNPAQQNVNPHNRSSSLRVKSELGQNEIFLQQQPRPPFPSYHQPMELPRNPVLDRLTGKVNPTGAVRSESYYRATNEPRPHPLVQQRSPMYQHPHQGPPPQLHLESQPVQNRRGEFLIIENDYPVPSKPPRRSGSSTPEDVLADRKRSLTNSSDISGPTTTTAAPTRGPTGDVLPSDVTYASQTSLEEDAGGFARDAFGRQSMSEKRHATLDAKGTDTYQRNKKLREERERQRMEELSRNCRGIKRPFTASNESQLNQQQRQSTETVECVGERRKSGGTTFGDQLRVLLHQWSLKEKQSHKSGTTLQRVGSTDSLVESLKAHQSPPRPSGHGHGHGHQRGERRSKKDIGPSLGMKKSSSLESLQTMVQEIQIQEDVKSGYGPLRSGPAPVRVVRGRGCNESFRQAVDRSYEAPLGDYENEMETLAEEESESCFSGTTNHPPHPYPQSSAEYIDGIYGKTKGSIGSGSVAAKKKGGLFRGLGSMFRFGRHRKSTHGPLSANELRKQQAEILRLEKEDQEQAELDMARQVAQAENLRIQEQYRRLVERQQREESRNPPPESSYGGGGGGITVSIGTKSPGYSTLKLPNNNNLRPNHPFRKSMDCHRVPSRSAERAPAPPIPDHLHPDVNGNPNTPSHLRSASYDLYNEFTRPGSRLGIADSKKYSHYINYDEIRYHLNSTNNGGENNGGVKVLSGDQLRQMKNTVVEQRKKAILESRRHQQHYHSQRRDHPKEPRQERPVSNFYEYESVQAAMNQIQNHADEGHKSGMMNPQQTQQHHQQIPPNQTRHHHHQQPIYVVRPNNNGPGTTMNGVTLPSPTTIPFGHPVLRQRSPSQFQAPQQPPFYATRQQQFITNQQQQMSSSNFQKQNSLPRRSQNVPPPPPKPQQQQQQQPQSIGGPITSHRHSQQQLGLPTRYSMTHSSSSTHTHVKTMQQQPVSPPYFQQPQILIGGPTFSQQNNAGGSGGHSLGIGGQRSTTSLGSKV